MGLRLPKRVWREGCLTEKPPWGKLQKPLAASRGSRLACLIWARTPILAARDAGRRGTRPRALRGRIDRGAMLTFHDTTAKREVEVALDAASLPPDVNWIDAF